MLYADDYGFCDQTHRAIQDAKAARRDLEDLIKAELLIRFETGVVCVRHWWRHNSIQKSRRIETVFLREKEILILRFYDSRTQMDVAKRLNISQAQVSRLEKGAISSLRRYISVPAQ